MAQVKSLKTGIKFKDTPIGKIPVDWEASQLGDICDIVGGSTPSTANKENWDGNILWATPTDITALKDRTIDDTKQKITKEGLSSCGTKLLPVGTILMTSRATIGACAINTKPMATNQGFTSLICKEKGFNWFVYYLVAQYHNEFERLATGSTFKEISKKSAKSLHLPFPPLPEQKKIAEILSNVDDAIEETDRIIKKAKELKKGLMQKLLTRGIGHKKFKETNIGRIPKEWDVVRLMDISKVNPEQIGNSYPKKNQIKYLDISGITQTGYIKEIKDVTFEEAPSRARRIARKNDILVSTVRPYLRAFARLKTCPDDFIVSTGYAVIRPEKPEDSEYIYQNILNEQFIKFLLPHMTGTNYPAVRPNDIGNYLIAFPKESERKEIADMLAAIDSDIESEENNRGQLELLKKSLMQVLLTGKVRVKIT